MGAPAVAECGAGEAGLGCGSSVERLYGWRSFPSFASFRYFQQESMAWSRSDPSLLSFLTHSLGLPSKKQKEIRWSPLIQVGSTETVIVHQVSIVFMSQPFSGWEDSSKNLSFHFSLIHFFVFLSGFPTDSFELTEKPSFAKK